MKLTEDQFFDQFKPIKNHFDANASYDGHMFETYGQEYEFVNEQLKVNPLKVWTLVEGCDDDNLYITEGWHFVNRLGYFVTEVPAEFGVQYNINDKPEPEISEPIVVNFNNLGEMLLKLTEGEDDEPKCSEAMLMAFNNVIEHCVDEAEYFLSGDGSDTINHQEISLCLSKIGSIVAQVYRDQSFN